MSKMLPDDRPLMDKSKTRLWLAESNRWPCCGGWYPGVHRNQCMVDVKNVKTPSEFLREFSPNDSHDTWRNMNPESDF
jgi:hypothetical protein